MTIHIQDTTPDRLLELIHKWRTEQEWRERGLCAQHYKARRENIFFSKPGTKAANRAISMCARCDVQQECAEYAAQQPLLEGIWAGKHHRAGMKVPREAVYQWLDRHAIGGLVTITAGELGQELGMQRSSTERALAKLRRDGRIRTYSQKPYRIQVIKETP